MKSSTLAVTAAAAALAGSTAFAQCDARIQDMQTRHGELFTSGDAGASQGRPVLRDLREAALRLQQQGLNDACEQVVDAMETTIAAYQQFGEEAPTEASPESSEVVPPAIGGPAARTVETTGAATVGTGLAGTTEVTGTTADANGQTAAAAVTARPVVSPGQFTPEQVQQRAIPIAQSDVPLNTTEMQNQDVYSYNGEDLGDFEGMLIRQGQPSHVVISHGGILEMGSNDVAVPVDLVSWDPEWQVFVVPFGDEELQGAPQYDREAGTEWDWTRNDQYWGQFRG